MLYLLLNFTFLYFWPSFICTYLFSNYHTQLWISYSNPSITGMWISLIPSSLLNQNYSVLKALFSDYNNEKSGRELTTGNAWYLYMFMFIFIQYYIHSYWFSQHVFTIYNLLFFRYWYLLYSYMFSFNDKESERASEMGQLGMAVGIACNIFLKKKFFSFVLS